MKNIKSFKKFNEMVDTKTLTTDELDKSDIIIRNYNVLLYPEQVVPIHPKYEKSDVYYVVPNDIDLSDRFTVGKGDELYLEISSPVNGKADSANSYKVCNNTTNKKIPLLNLIPTTAVGGEISHPLHYDAITQLKNLDSILKGELETSVQSINRKIDIVETMIPKEDFWISKPYNSSYGFEAPHKVIFKDNKYLYLREAEWVTKENYFEETQKELNDEYEFNVWDEFETKHDLAWSIYMNAKVILNKSELNSENHYHKEWSAMYDLITKRCIEEYKTPFTKDEIKILKKSLNNGIEADYNRKKKQQKLINKLKTPYVKFKKS